MTLDITRDTASLSLTQAPFSFSAIDWQDAGEKAALAVWQRWRLRAGVPCPRGDLVHLVGENSSRTFLVERDHAQGRPSGHRDRPLRDGAPPESHTGLIVGMLVTGIAVGTVTAILGVVLISLGMGLKARMEEGFLTAELGADAYGSYCRRVPMLIPFLPPT